MIEANHMLPESQLTEWSTMYMPALGAGHLSFLQNIAPASTTKGVHVRKLAAARSLFWCSPEGVSDASADEPLEQNDRS